ncbi:unnamed protein product [Taenia asiatica]|uniref:TPR_REGION domain-containing protein n=1 Tax=Taenia asiatica TaxID=60517 RepID=A0A158R766_TAEAS|nr:unnamed protein product [Taenia asiatica]
MVESSEELRLRGNSFFSEGNYLEAVKSYKECLRKADGDKSCQQIAYRNLAQCYIKLCSYDEAIKAATEALKILPSDTKALYRRSVAYEKIGNLKDSIVDAQKLVQLEPNNKAVKDLIHRVESCVVQKREFECSLKGKINSMFSMLTDEKSPVDLIETALKNLIALIKEEDKAAATEIWSHPSSSEIFGLINNPSSQITNLALVLLENIMKAVPTLSVIILDKMTLKYIVGRVLSPSADASLHMCKFLSHLMENLTQIRAYQKARDAAVELAKRNKSQAQSFLPKVVYPPYKLEAELEGPVEKILEQILRVTNSYRLEAAARDILLQLLTWIIPSETGIGWSKRIVTAEGNLERILEVAAATCSQTPMESAGQSEVVGAKSRHKHLLEEASTKEGLPEISRGGVLKISANTRMIVACLLSRLFNDLRSDQDRQHFSRVCCEFVMELLTDKFIESKVEAAAVIGTLFSGPYEVGSRVLATEGILEGLLLLSQSENLAYQTVALDTIILATNKKDKCMAVINQAVPILRALYKSPDDGVKVRALLGLCKLGALGGGDASIKSMADGSTVILMKACRRLLLGESASEKPENGARSDATSMRWAIDGLAYLSLNGEVKEALVKDAALLNAVYKVAALGYYDTAFPLVSLLANLTNSFVEKEITPEMLEIAKFAKQHIPEKHEADEPKVVTQRRQKMIDAGLPTCLYNLTTKLVTKTSAAQPQVREVVSRIYLSCSECVDSRGLLVSAGAGKALLNLSLEDNTDEGKHVASQALAKLTITADPRLTFPGERSLEVIRPLLQLLDMECPALQNFEGLLALTNLASLDHKHRCRMLQEGALPKIEHYMFEDHEELRHAAVECFSNLAQHPAVVVACGGELPAEAVGGVACGASGSEVVKLLTLYCYDEKDIFLVRAAAGALATMSHDPGILHKITQVDKWKEKMEALAAHPSPTIQHRAVFLLRNLIVCGGSEIARDIVDSRLVELIDYLQHLPDISDTDALPPEAIVLSQGRPKAAVREEAKSDRKKTRDIASAAMRKLIEYGFIKQTQSVNP